MATGVSGEPFVGSRENPMDLTEEDLGLKAPALSKADFLRRLSPIDTAAAPTMAAYRVVDVTASIKTRDFVVICNELNRLIYQSMGFEMTEEFMTEEEALEFLQDEGTQRILSSFRKLDLSNKGLHYLDIRILKCLSILDELILDNNQFTTYPAYPDIFGLCPRLRHVSLLGNPIKPDDIPRDIVASVRFV